MHHRRENPLSYLLVFLLEKLLKEICHRFFLSFFVQAVLCIFCDADVVENFSGCYFSIDGFIEYFSSLNNSIFNETYRRQTVFK